MRGAEGQGAYYRAALQALRFVESRRATGRRFGAEADALWSSFRGDLGTSARIDVLLRDADTEWPGAFGARSVYDLGGVAEDEAFGAAWQPLDDVDAEALWRELRDQEPPSTPADALAAMARAWDLSLGPVEVGAVGPTDGFIVAGPSAIAALVAAFAGGQDLDWSAQVTVVATPPAHRHLAAAAAALVNVTAATRLFAAGQPAPGRPGARVLVSADADPTDRAAAEQKGT